MHVEYDSNAWLIRKLLKTPRGFDPTLILSFTSNITLSRKYYVINLPVYEIDYGIESRGFFAEICKDPRQ